MMDIHDSKYESHKAGTKEQKRDFATKLITQLNCVSDEKLFPAYLKPYKKSIKQICLKKDNDGISLLEKYSISSFLKKISKKEFKDLSNEFEKLEDGKANLHEFINIFFMTVTIPENPLEKLCVVASLVELFTEVTRHKKNPYITWQEINNAILNNFVEETQISEFGIANKYVYKSDTLKRCLSPRSMSEVFFNKIIF